MLGDQPARLHCVHTSLDEHPATFKGTVGIPSRFRMAADVLQLKTTLLESRPHGRFALKPVKLPNRRYRGGQRRHLDAWFFGFISV